MPTISGFPLVLLTLAVSLGIFMNILDTSIANVAIPTIAGNLAVSADEGTWVITSFTVSLAIMLPLTGWLAKRFGEVRLFVVSTLLFSVASLLCGLSDSLQMLVICRVIQGAVAGPMIPLSQSILLANYPEEDKGLATALWATVAVAAPILGPVLGGYITDNYSWPWIFYINLPVGLFSAYFTWKLLRDRETTISKPPIDYIGILLLIIGVGCLQVLLDKGKDLDWFNSPFIITLSIISFIAISFLIVWELTEEHPILDLKLFLKRNFTIGTIVISLGFMAYFGGIVILPLWLQVQMNYTPSWAGLATAPFGIIPLLLSPFLAVLMKKLDLRLLVSIGFLFFSGCSFWIASFNTSVDIHHIQIIRFIQGIGISLFFIPTIAIFISDLDPKDVASGSGLANFSRTLAGSFGTSIFVTIWANRETFHQSRLIEHLDNYTPQMQQTMQHLQTIGITDKSAYAVVLKSAVSQAYMLATNDIFWLSGVLFLLLLIVVWFARPPFLVKTTNHAVD